jgi:hypothetical protein
MKSNGKEQDCVHAQAVVVCGERRCPRCYELELERSYRERSMPRGRVVVFRNDHGHQSFRVE